MLPASGIMQRASGAVVVMREGHLLLYLDRGGRHLLTFGEDELLLSEALEGLRDLLAERNRKAIRIDKVDGQGALQSPRADWLRSHGLSADHRGFAIERRV